MLSFDFRTLFFWSLLLFSGGEHFSAKNVLKSSAFSLKSETNLQINYHGIQGGCTESFCHLQMFSVLSSTFYSWWFYQTLYKMALNNMF